MTLTEANVIDEEIKKMLENINHDNAKSILIYFFQHFIKDEVPDVDIVILITKKSFWSYNVLSSEFGNDPDNDIEWLSDRYFQKIIDFSEYDGKTIVIVDDTMNTGVAIREFYKLMRGQCKKSKIIPIVCLLNGTYSQDEHVTDQSYIEFHTDLRIMGNVQPAYVGKMCVFETEMFHDDLVSYIVDLPILEQKKSDGSWNRKVSLPIETFQNMCKGNGQWTYYECNYKLIPGRDVKSGFFSLHSSFLNARLASFIMNLVVKVQYKENDKNEDDGMQVVFTPFAILNSAKAVELESCFKALFNNSLYNKQLKKPQSADMVLNYYTAMYRAVVYCLSMYIGVKFIKFMNVNQELRLNNEKQFTREFYRSIDKLFPQKDNYKEFDELKFLSRLLSVSAFTKVKNVEYDSFDNGEMKFINYSKEDWFAFLYEKIIFNKRCVTDRKCFSSEEFEGEIGDKLAYDNKAEKTALLTQVLLEALNKSILSNYLCYDDRTKTIIRGYRYGENSELLLPYDARIFYKGISIYYAKVKDRFFDYFAMFCSSFRNFLKRIGIFDYLMSERQFDFFVRYFGGIPENEIAAQIENKGYLLSDDYCRQDNALKYVLSKIDSFVVSMDFGKEE